MSVVTLICSEPLKATMAGIAIRYTELATVLANAGFKVHLYAPHISPEGYAVPAGVSVHTLSTELNEPLIESNVVIVQGHISERVMDVLPDTPIVVDLYDPYLIENVSYHNELGPEVFNNDLRNWQRLAQRGDFFLCASEQQRLFYLGFLLAQGRITPEQLIDDADLRGLIDVVPFGVPSSLPAYQPLLKPIKGKTFRVLFGGVYDWYDPFTLLEALDTASFCDVELILVRSPNPDTTPQRLFREVQEWVAKSDWPETRLVLLDWVPYARRFDLLREVDVMVAPHSDTLETRLSLRTRYLDAIAVACPVISSDGGGVADIVRQYRAGIVVPPNHVQALRSAIESIMSKETSQMLGRSDVSAFVKDFQWQTIVEPLVKFCGEPRLASQKQRSRAIKNSPVENIGVQFSVLLPTYNRMDILPEVIDALEQQWAAPPFDLIIVNDGSSDGTKEWLDERTFTIPVTIVHQQNTGPAGARNRGIELALGDYVVLLGDDTVPNRHWLRAHFDAHQQRYFDLSIIVVGQTDWHARMRHTPFINYVDQTGWQFAFDKIEDPENLSYNYFYGSNVSVATHHLQAECFDTSFPYPAWEDSELGYRLQRNGCRLVFQQAARTAHLHPTTVARFANRQLKAGYCAMVFNQLHPEVGALVWPSADSLKNASGEAVMVARRWLAMVLEPMSLALPTLWNKVLRDHYVAGIRRYLKEHNIDYQILSRQDIFPLNYPARSPLLHHQTGRLDDTRWVCEVGCHDPGHCVFGPNYRVSEAAQMVVKFFVSCEQPSLRCHAVTLDVYDNRADMVLAEQVLYSDYLNQSVLPHLEFATEPGQQLEFRVYWHGECSITVTNIELNQRENDH